MTFLFDIGRVLLDFDYGPALARLLPPGTADAEERVTRLLERKDEFEAGRISEAEYIPWALSAMGSTVSHDTFREAWRSIFLPNEPMWDAVSRLAAAGHRLILFSNINPIHSPWLYGAFPGFRHFHSAVMSFETGFIKPEPGIYQYAIRTHGLVPEETFYIDDLPANIAAGCAFGFRTHLYDLHQHAAFEAWLAEEIPVFFPS